jgi:prepilin-type N-terminal cleavage/methylation domain-containing protein
VRRGYTLIETTVVLLVLALAAGVAAPAIGRGLDAIRLRTEVAGVASFLRAARERAITQRHALDVRIDEAGRTLTLNAGDEDVRAVRHLSVLHIEADPRAARTVTFFAYGLSTGGRFRLEAAGPVVYVVTVSPLTGRVSTRRGDS